MGFRRAGSATVLFAALALSACGHTSPELAEPAGSSAPPGYRLVWSDEFNEGRLPDPDKWTYDTYRNKDGWWNKELQYYSAAREKNVRIENGVLLIEAHRETLTEAAFPDWGGQAYTSARLLTKGLESWTYGYFEIRAKLACGRGTWPAIWMLPDGTSTWPDDGEIDIMEYLGHDEGKVHATVHTRDYNHSKGTHQTAATRVDDPCGAFHVYTLHWTPEAITIGADGADYYTFENTGEGYGAWPFDQPQHLILNLAIGGWGGAKGIDEEIFPVRLEIDHVRVWQKP